MTKRQLEVLRKMRDDKDNELVYSRGIAYIGLERVAPRTVFALLREMAISMDQFSEVGDCERYTINDIGLKILGSK